MKRDRGIQPQAAGMVNAHNRLWTNSLLDRMDAIGAFRGGLGSPPAPASPAARIAMMRDR